MTGTRITRYPEPVGNGRAIMRVDVVHDGRLVESHTEGSPAPIDTVRRAADTDNGGPR